MYVRSAKMRIHHMGLPGYRELADSGALACRAEEARRALFCCTLCPHECRIDRTVGERGLCGAGDVAKIYRHMVHPGEEPAISCVRGSGTIFWSHCTMSCRYCQNYRMSCHGEGTDRSVRDVADMMISLERAGCHNINLVSPTQFTPHILDALVHTADEGGTIPVVWNTSGYESQETLAMLDGVVDIYLTDIRYASGEAARKYSDAPDYVEVNRAAIIEMKRQVGSLTFDNEGAASQGLIVRHLVLPGDISGTAESIRFLAEEVGRDTHVSLMAQYYPAHRAHEYPELARRITRKEWERAREALADFGLENGWVQAYHGGELYPMAGTEIEGDA
jgi:putative pyruvate formate lyase activating enzyme